MTKLNIGVIGMAVMGRNLALNIASKGYPVGIYNRTYQRTKEVIEANPQVNLHPAESLEELIDSLSRPRVIFIMVQAGSATDSVINQLQPLLDQEDIIVDCGNTLFTETLRRSQELEGTGISFVGMGVSGGEEGALLGPSLMPGCSKEAYQILEPILSSIAAKVGDNKEACVSHIGPNGSGHFVKMVHNGIEYGDMQLIAETYHIMSKLLKLNHTQMSECFNQWNQGELNSYLIEITADILSQRESESGQPIVDFILDTAGNKGTGKWTSQSALDYGVPLPTITEAVFARYISAMKSERLIAADILKGPERLPDIKSEEEFLEKLRQSLYFAKIMSYAQGFYHLQQTSHSLNWSLNFKEIARIWRGGCIIRAQFLENIMEAFASNPDLENILLDDYFMNIGHHYQDSIRQVISIAVQAGIPVPALSSAIAYFDSYRSAVLPANLIQAQRDYFGAHTYQRIDREGQFHYIWDQGREEQISE